MKVNKTSISVSTGKTSKITIADSVNMANVKSIKYTASGTKVKVSKTGVITAKRKGTTKVKVIFTLTNGKKVTRSVKITVK